jgi:hypothetical protein
MGTKQIGMITTLGRWVKVFPGLFCRTKENLMSVALDMIINIPRIAFASDTNFRFCDSSCIGKFPAVHSVLEKIPKAYRRPKNKVNSVQIRWTPEYVETCGFAKGLSGVSDGGPIWGGSSGKLGFQIELFSSRPGTISVAYVYLAWSTEQILLGMAKGHALFRPIWADWREAATERKLGGNHLSPIEVKIF